MGLMGAAAVSGAVGAGLTGVVGGLSQAAQSTALFDRDDRRRLAELEGMRRRGELGLSDNARTRIEADHAAQRGGVLRSLESQQTQGMQQLANRQALSGRELFLTQMAGQQAEVDLANQQAQRMAEQNMAARRAQLAEIQQLEEQRRARRAGVRGGLTQALTGGLLGAAGGVAQEKYAQAQARLAMQNMEDNARKIRQMGISETDAEVLGALAPALYPSR